MRLYTYDQMLAEPGVYREEHRHLSRYFVIKGVLFSYEDDTLREVTEDSRDYAAWRHFTTWQRYQKIGEVICR